MNLENVLSKKRSAILGKWFKRIVETYPEETAQFLRREKDPFANPVGRSIRDGMAGIIDQLLNADDLEEVGPFLDKIIRVRAVQDFTPSQALSFIFDLKEIIREELLDENADTDLYKQIMMFESKIDGLAFRSFDIYSGCREQLYEIKIKETTDRVGKLLERANKLWEKRGEPRVS